LESGSKATCAQRKCTASLSARGDPGRKLEPTPIGMAPVRPNGIDHEQRSTGPVQEDSPVSNLLSAQHRIAALDRIPAGALPAGADATPVGMRPAPKRKLLSIRREHAMGASRSCVSAPLVEVVIRRPAVGHDIATSVVQVKSQVVGMLVSTVVEARGHKQEPTTLFDDCQAGTPQ
jgi:hypothetical protein